MQARPGLPTRVPMAMRTNSMGELAARVGEREDLVETRIPSDVAIDTWLASAPDESLRRFLEEGVLPPGMAQLVATSEAHYQVHDPTRCPSLSLKGRVTSTLVNRKLIAYQVPPRPRHEDPKSVNTLGQLSAGLVGLRRGGGVMDENEGLVDGVLDNAALAQQAARVRASRWASPTSYAGDSAVLPLTNGKHRKAE